MDEAKRYALSDADLQEALQPDTNILLYPQLNEMTHIDQCFDRLGRCIMLYPTESPMSGHWVSMIKRGNTIEYFDPYGLAPEAPRDWLGPEENQLYGSGQNRLSQLFRESGYKVHYNCFPYQKMSASIATCGRWALARLICKDLGVQKFHQLVKHSKLNPDEFAVALTYRLLGK